jgi:hypothetical protein
MFRDQTFDAHAAGRTTRSRRARWAREHKQNAAPKLLDCANVGQPRAKKQHDPTGLKRGGGASVPITPRGTLAWNVHEVLEAESLRCRPTF